MSKLMKIFFIQEDNVSFQKDILKLVIKDKTLRTNALITGKIELAIFFGLTQVQTVKTNHFNLKKKMERSY